METPPDVRDRALALLASWDRQQELHRPGREQGLRALVDTVALHGTSTAVVEFGSGCGSVLTRLRSRMPTRELIGIDSDPVLMEIARRVLGDDAGVRLVNADLTSMQWPDVCESPVDAVVSCTTLHWLSSDRLDDLYVQLADRIPAGGIFCNLDWMPVTDSPATEALAARYLDDHARKAAAAGALTWRQWWDALESEPDLQPYLAQRARAAGARPAEFMPPSSWHREHLLHAGFREAVEVWRSWNSAVLLAIR